MRNILEYPITWEEKVMAVKWALDVYRSNILDQPDPPIGDITGAALMAVLEDDLGESV